MARTLNGMVVLVTGASAGIGRALAEELARQGARLALMARRLDRLEELCRTLGGEHLCIRGDVSRSEDCQEAVRRTHERFGRIDTLVCNAGYGMIRPVAEMSLEEMDRIFRTNVFGTTECIRFAVPVMREQTAMDGWRGQIILVSSAAARRGLPDFGAYSATKAAQLSLAEALRVELRPAGIAVTSVHPVGTDTDFFTTAEQLSSEKMNPRSVIEIHQSAAQVARKIIRGIRRPRPEVWPFAPVRWALLASQMLPRLTDWVMGRHRRV